MASETYAISASLPKKLPFSFRVHSAFTHAVNLLGENDEWFTIVTASKPLVPQGWKVATDVLPPIKVGESVTLRDGILTFEHTAWRVALSAAQRIDLHGETLKHHSPQAWREATHLALLTISGQRSQREKAPLWKEPAFQEAPLDEQVTSLLGRGPGLTPSGDDFLLGWLWSWQHWAHPRTAALQEAILKRRSLTIPISQHFFTLVLAGQWVECLKVAETRPFEGFSWLAQQGASSGGDTLEGIAFGFHTLASVTVSS